MGIYFQKMYCPKCGTLGDELVNEIVGSNSFVCHFCPYSYADGDHPGFPNSSDEEIAEFYRAIRPGINDA